jgi:hypothetical protein
MSDKLCEHCGAKTVKYKHTFSKALAIGLYKLYQSGHTPINLKNLALTRNQWDNFQKLRYWGLVAQAHREDGTRLNGEWFITPLGVDFIEKGTAIKKSVWTYRGVATEFEGDTCFFFDVHETEYKKRTQYAVEAVAHGD